jgi:hypothetical protein
MSQPTSSSALMLPRTNSLFHLHPTGMLWRVPTAGPVCHCSTASQPGLRYGLPADRLQGVGRLRSQAYYPLDRLALAA